MSKAAKAGSGSGSKPVEVTPMPDISALSKAEQKKFLKEWLKIQKMKVWTDNLEKITDAVSMTALFLGQYGIYQHGQEDKVQPAAVAGVITSLVYMLKDNHSEWATGIVLLPLMTKVGWDVMMKLGPEGGFEFTGDPMGLLEQIAGHVVEETTPTPDFPGLGGIGDIIIGGP